MTDSASFLRLARENRLPLLAAAAVALLLLAGVAMVLNNEQSYKEAKTQQVDAQALIMASIVTAALAFDDHKTAQEYLNALDTDPAIQAAAIYDSRGQLFADYSRTSQRAPQRTAMARESTVDGETLIVTRPVRQGGVELGTIYLQAIVEPITRRLERYGLIALLVTMASLIPVMLGVAQIRLSRANERLKQQGLDLAKANEELRAQIERRERAETALRQAQKMEAIGQLTGGIAHDFNNLLQVIIGNLEVLQRRGVADSDDSKRMLSAAARNAERAAVLTQRLLAFSRRQPLDLKPIDVNKLVTGMSDLFHRALGETIRLETVLSPNLWRVAADGNQLENALLNLVVNARDAMPQGGRLTIETANTYLDEPYAHANELRAGQYVSVAVSDTGAGMSADVLDKVFEPFFTTKGVGKGSGLGLSQVYGLMKQSEGHVKIYSEVAQGTTVKLYLPRLVSKEDSQPIVPEARTAPRGSIDRIILVVEDDDDVRAHAVAMLRELGYGVLEAVDGASALAILDSQPVVHLLFTDVGLPNGMNGRQLADEALRHRPRLRVLFTTGYARNAIVHQGRLDAGVELITKPFTFAALADKVHRIISK